MVFPWCLLPWLGSAAAPRLSCALPLERRAAGRPPLLGARAAALRPSTSDSGEFLVWGQRSVFGLGMVRLWFWVLAWGRFWVRFAFFLVLVNKNPHESA